MFVDDGSADAHVWIRSASSRLPTRGSSTSRSRATSACEAAFSAGYRYAGKPWVVHLDADLHDFRRPRFTVRSSERWLAMTRSSVSA